jgi:splicing factor 3B subunit 1
MQPLLMMPNPEALPLDDKHNRYLSDKELDVVLPATGYGIVAPPPRFA